jgi:hypothetical protein
VNLSACRGIPLASEHASTRIETDADVTLGGSRPIPLERVGLGAHLRTIWMIPVA